MFMTVFRYFQECAAKWPSSAFICNDITNHNAARAMQIEVLNSPPAAISGSREIFLSFFSH
ncbi:hypothetical protein BN2364_2330 [Alloalcanivorax xenomutans]|nr:hypothetical protein BN2364_2330 [Alloalcanivorax xenomutans]